VTCGGEDAFSSGCRATLVTEAWVAQRRGRLAEIRILEQALELLGVRGGPAR
jgi:hypothetical protein